MLRNILASAAALVLLAVTGPTSASVVFSDPFTDGGRTNGTDPQDIAWYSLLNGITPSVANDTILGSGNSMLLSGDQPLAMGGFAPTTLGAGTGSIMQLSFDFRVTVASSNSGAFRFGLLDQKATKVTSDAVVNASQDRGYRVNLGVGTAGAGLFLDAGTNDTGMAGTDGGSNLASGLTAINLAPNTKYSGLLRVTRVTGGGVAVYAEVRDAANTILTSGTSGTLTGGSLIDTFDAVGFFNTRNTTSSFAVDNVTVVVPEPTTLALAGVAGLGLIRRRARRRD